MAKKKKKQVKKPSKKKVVVPKKRMVTKPRLKGKPVKKIKTRAKKVTKSSSREKKILEIRKALLLQRENLLKEAEEALNTLPGEINFPDMGDQATAETDRNFMLRLRDRERMLLKKVDEAIEKIENGTFGICEGCGNKIDIKRLTARPVTTLCIDCKTRQEEEEKIAEG